LHWRQFDADNCARVSVNASLSCTKIGRTLQLGLKMPNAPGICAQIKKKDGFKPRSHMTHDSQSDPLSAQRSKPNVQELLPGAKEGDKTAINLLLARYRPYLRVICSLQPQFCQSRDDESDIVQHTLIDATRGLAEFRGETEEEFGAWIAKLLERNILQSLRRHTADKRDVRRETIDWNPSGSAQLVWHSLATSQSSPENSIFRGEAALQLAEALENLPADQRTALELRYLGQQSLKSISEYMSKSTGSVAGLLRRGIEKLRDVLPPEFPGVP
jgi:RNA polymerase sigma-70 factor (ECF subfamily)